MHDNRKKRSNNRENIEDVLPSSQILEKFEDAVPDSVEDLLEMAKIEQEHRHEWQSNYSRSHDVTFRFGQLFGFIYNIGLLYVVYNLITSGQKDLGLKIFAINAALMAFAIIATTIERKIFSRRPSRRKNNRRSPRKDSNRNRNQNNKNSQGRR